MAPCTPHLGDVLVILRLFGYLDGDTTNVFVLHVCICISVITCLMIETHETWRTADISNTLYSFPFYALLVGHPTMCTILCIFPFSVTGSSYHDPVRDVPFVGMLV